MKYAHRPESERVTVYHKEKMEEAYQAMRAAQQAFIKDSNHHNLQLIFDEAERVMRHGEPLPYWDSAHIIAMTRESKSFYLRFRPREDPQFQLADFVDCLNDHSNYVGAVRQYAFVITARMGEPRPTIDDFVADMTIRQAERLHGRIIHPLHYSTWRDNHKPVVRHTEKTLKELLASTGHLQYFQ